MKKLLTSTFLCAAVFGSYAQTAKKINDTTYLQPVEVNAVRAGDKAPFAKTNISKKEIRQNNLGQDLPFLLNQAPGVVVNSDAGNGVGYTGIRIRGTDATRINVTLNGIPYNDAESQGTFFVDLPDFSSSVNSVQIQRGIGTSSNGSGAFGGTINLSTNELNTKHYLEINNSYGSFNTLKNTVQFGTGIFGKHFTFDGRLSNISSDGYIDRAKTALSSFYTSTAYTDDKNSLRLNIFSGKEKTYQAWNGVPQDSLATHRTYNSSGTDKPGTPYNNQVDDYVQTHFQLFYNHKFNNNWKGNIAVFLTKGKGYYEEYKGSAALADYGLPDYTSGTATTTETDIIRRLWLDNNFYGTIFSLQYQQNKTQLTFGGGYNQYDGKHYGEIIWAAVQPAVPANYRWYNVPATKKDASFYTKWTQQLARHWQSFIDIQYRYVGLDIKGFKNNPDVKINQPYNFVNPKLGITYNKNSWQAYASYSLAQHEPNRDDFEAGKTQLPKAELLNDFELGLQKKKTTYSFGATLYYMHYHNQLILTGQINDVGAYTRTNIPVSYRTGIELEGAAKFSSWFNAAGNIAFSANKIKNFTEYIDDYDNGGQQTNFYKNTDIALSPAVVAGASLNFIPLKNSGVSLISKYVSKQYLDNTGKSSRSLDGYYVQDVRLNYTFNTKTFKAIEVIVQLNNIFAKKYEPNGYTYSYIYAGELTTENYYFPMARFNCMAGVNIKL